VLALKFVLLVINSISREACESVKEDRRFGRLDSRRNSIAVFKIRIAVFVSKFWPNSSSLHSAIVGSAVVRSVEIA